jgi:RNA polymerase sigma-70 factor (ECF subfamily)
MLWGHHAPVRREDFEKLYELHAQDLFGFLAYRSGDRALAEDLVAQTFERALRSWRSFKRSRGSEKNWLYAIALKCLRDHLRRREVERGALERHGLDTEMASNPGANPGEAAVEARDAVGRALESLSNEEREAIALRFGADLTVPEIAGLTKEKLTTIEGRVYRALRKMRDEMND